MADPVVTLGWFVCLTVTMMTGDLTAYGTESITVGRGLQNERGGGGK